MRLYVGSAFAVPTGRTAVVPVTSCMTIPSLMSRAFIQPLPGTQNGCPPVMRTVRGPISSAISGRLGRTVVFITGL